MNIYDIFSFIYLVVTDETKDINNNNYYYYNYSQHHNHYFKLSFLYLP